jgi:TATA-binding protein-associated factor Taf7
VLLVVDPTIGRPNTYESDDGVTPPMRKARARHFKPRVTLPPEVMAEAVSDVVEMLAGR